VSAISQSAVAQSTISIDDSSIVVSNGSISLPLPFDLPTRDEILTALPKSELDREGARIACELEAYKVEKPRFYPLVGMARLAHTEFKCTVHSGQRKEAVTLRRDRLIRSE
jgi:hypothetical protein